MDYQEAGKLVEQIKTINDPVLLEKLYLENLEENIEVNYAKKWVREAVLLHNNCPPNLLEKELSQENQCLSIEDILNHPQCNSSTFETLVKSRDIADKLEICLHQNCPAQIKEQLNQELKLELEFKKVYIDISDQIKEKLKLANQYLAEAERLSKENGIPFSSNISPISQDYFPNTFASKWADLSKNSCELDEQKQLVEELGCGNYGNEYDYGWEHSAICS